jgi:two-component system nitrate/nitrite response regulator NarL
LAVAWSALNLEEMRQKSAQSKPSVVLIDKALGINSISEVIRLWSEGAGPVAAVWGNTMSETDAVRLIQAGAKGVLQKSIEPESLVRCFRAISRGQVWIEEAIFRPRPRNLPREPRYGLTPREAEVFRLVRIGLSNNEIAEELGIRPGTVKIHLKHLYEKTGLRGRFQLALAKVQEPESLEMTA